MVEAKCTGELEFRVYAPGADQVELVGSFTDWDRSPERMSQADDGWWTFRAEIKPGDHEFYYLIDRHRRQADYAAHGVRLNPFGEWVSGLSVPRADVDEASRLAA